MHYSCAEGRTCIRDGNKTESNAASRRRRSVRSSNILTVIALSCTPSVSGMVSATKRINLKRTSVRSIQNVVEFPVKPVRPQSERDIYESYFGDTFDDEILDLKVLEEVSSVSDLETATGSEIPDKELHQKLENARAQSPDQAGAAFVNSYVEDASMTEKFAMSLIPMQLPEPATKEIISTATKSARKSKTQSRPNHRTDKRMPFGMNDSTLRVTHEQELELARIIQRGAPLHKLKAEFEESHARDITRQEWADLAGLKSTKELRRLVSDYRSAKQTLVAANMGLVHSIVKDFSSNRRGASKEELLQEGSLGLLRAAELFDPSRGLRFSTYATIWIKGILSNSNVASGNTISMPLREKTKWNKIRQATELLRKEYSNENYQPTNAELAEKTGLTAKDIAVVCRKVTLTQHVLSLDYKYAIHSRSGEATDSSFQCFQNDKAFMADADIAEKLQMRADIIAALVRNLDPREARLVRLRYGLKDGQPRTLSECAELMGLSQGRTQQLAAQCLKKLREADDAESLQEYLMTIR